jgi:hypothetical protein
MEDIPYIELRELFIQSYQLLIATETTPILLSTELFKCGSQLIVRWVLTQKCIKCDNVSTSESEIQEIPNHTFFDTVLVVATLIGHLEGCGCWT